MAENSYIYWIEELSHPPIIFYAIEQKDFLFFTIQLITKSSKEYNYLAIVLGYIDYNKFISFRLLFLHN